MHPEKFQTAVIHINTLTGKWKLLHCKEKR